MARVNAAFNRWLLEQIEVPPSAKVLEIGLGPGVGIGLLAAAVPEGKVVGVDHSAEMVRQASTRNAAAISRGRVELRRADAENLPFEADSFDLVVAVASIHLVPDPLTALREAWRVLRPGGRLALGFYSATGQIPADVLRDVESTGFIDARVLESKEGFGLVAVKPAAVDTSAGAPAP